MSSWRFLLSRRWLLFALVVLILTSATAWLGQWQFSRLDDRKAENSVVRTNEELEPAPVDEVLSVDDAVDEDDEWRVVTAVGRYAVEDTVIVRYRTRDGIAGVDVVVPLVTDDGTALLVDRGWLRTSNAGGLPDQVPAPPEGEVEVTGYVRADSSGRGTTVDDLSTRAISSERIGSAIDRPTYDGFVELRSESPEPATPLVPVELPELDNGPHFFYGLQWWFFGLLALVGFGYLAYDEWRGTARGAAGSPPSRSGGPGAPTTPKPVTSERAARRAARRAATEAGLAKARAEKAEKAEKAGR